MNRASALAVARGLERLVDPGTVTGLSERQILNRFIERRDPVAFDAIVARHGPMVLAVCRQMLRDANDVDDAFQATFLILVQKAAYLQQPERLAAWLYGVAHRVASRTRRRRRPESLLGDLAGKALREDPAEVEAVALLHDELQRLPEKYRLPIVLCCVNKQTHDAVARQLGWPIGTVHGRLARGRDLLRGRLLRRGVTIPDPIFHSGASPNSVRDKTVPDPLLRSTLALLAGPIPDPMCQLVKGVLSAMFIEKVRATGLVLALTTLGVASATTALMAVQQPVRKAERPAGGAEGGDSRAPTTKGVVQNAGDPAEPIADAGAGADLEEKELHAAERIGTMRARVELLELENDALRNRIQRSMSWLDQLEDVVAPDDNRNASNEERARLAKRREEQRRNTQERIESLSKQFLEKRVEISRLNYQIASIPRPTAQAEHDDSGKTLYDLMRRIDQLEAKVDRLADSLRTGKR